MDISVITKSGRIERVHLEKIQERLKKLSMEPYPLNNVEHTNIAIKVASGIYSGVTTSELDDLSEEISRSSIVNNYEYDILASRIYMNKIYRNTAKSVKDIYKLNSNVTTEFRDIVETHYEEFDRMVAEFEQICTFNYMGLKTIEGSYLLRSNSKDIITLNESHNLYKFQKELFDDIERCKNRTKIVQVQGCDIEVPDTATDYSYLNLMEYANNDEDVAKKLYSIITMTNYNKVIERPSHMFLRTSIHIHSRYGKIDMEKIKETYTAFAKKFFIHASPTLMNSGINTDQLASCFLINMEDNSESIRSIFNDVAVISQSSGGVGISLSEIRSSGSIINSTMGETKGIVPLMRGLNELSRIWDQGGKRKGKFAIYLEPWHTEIREFLMTQSENATPENSCRDLLLAIWMCDLFVETAMNDGDWYLMCPKECPGLTDTYGEEFNKLYLSYVAKKKYKEVVKAASIMNLITDTMTEKGKPYILFKDKCNEKSNQKNIGVIKCSNLCAEILEHTNSNEYAVCNLANICLGHIMEEKINNRGIKRQDILNYEMEQRRINSELEKSLNVDISRDVNVNSSNNINNYNETIMEDIVQEFLDDVYTNTQILVENLNNCIDKNNYPVEKTANSNLKHRPMGIGIQGLADVFILLGLPFTSAKARYLNKRISAHMYYAALEKSHNLAVQFNNIEDEYYLGRRLTNSPSPILPGSYLTFENSPVNKGILQPHMWGLKTEEFISVKHKGEEKKWEDLIEKTSTGIRNSLLLSNMPTQATSHIMNMTECFEPITQLVFKKQVLSGTFIQLNRYFQNDMVIYNKWNKEFKNQLISNNGSIQDMDIPQYFKDLYKTIWEIKPSDLISMDADRGAYICQTQSSNRYIADPSYTKLFSMIIKAHQSGVKTACYYLRSKSAANAIKFTVAAEPKNIKTINGKKFECNDDICTSCQ